MTPNQTCENLTKQIKAELEARIRKEISDRLGWTGNEPISNQMIADVMNGLHVEVVMSGQFSSIPRVLFNLKGQAPLSEELFCQLEEFVGNLRRNAKNTFREEFVYDLNNERVLPIIKERKGVLNVAFTSFTLADMESAINTAIGPSAVQRR